MPELSSSSSPSPVQEIDPAEQLLPYMLDLMRQHPLESVDSIVDRLSRSPTGLDRRDIRRMVISAVGAERRLAASLQSLVSASAAMDPSGQTAFALAVAALNVVVA